MNRAIALLIGTMICAVVVKGGDVTVEAYMTIEQGGEAITTFPSDIEKLYATFKTKGVKNGDKVRGVWIADDVGEAAPKGFKIDERTFTAQGDTSDGEFSLAKPGAWPRGDYHIEIYVNDQLATKVKFTVKAAIVKKSQDDQQESSDDE